MFLYACQRHYVCVHVLNALTLMFKALKTLCSKIMLKNLPIMLLSIAQNIAHYANYAHVKELCLKSDCSIRVYLLVSNNYIFNMVSVLLEYIMFIISMLSVLLE